MTKQAAQRAAAQDYWHQVMTVADRAEVMKVTERQDGEGPMAYYHRLLDHVFATQEVEVVQHQIDQMAGFLTGKS